MGGYGRACCQSSWLIYGCPSFSTIFSKHDAHVCDVFSVWIRPGRRGCKTKAQKLGARQFSDRRNGTNNCQLGRSSGEAIACLIMPSRIFLSEVQPCELGPCLGKNVATYSPLIGLQLRTHLFRNNIKAPIAVKAQNNRADSLRLCKLFLEFCLEPCTQ